MADQHNDNIPAVGNTIAADVADIKENLEFHKDCFEAVTKGWSNTSAASLAVDVLADAVNWNGVSRTSSPATASGSAAYIEVTGLTNNAVYRITYIFSHSADTLFLRFNNDTTATAYAYVHNYAARASGSGTDSNTTDNENASIPLGATAGAAISYGTIYFYIDSTTVVVWGQTCDYKDTANLATINLNGKYGGASTVTSARILSAGENLTGKLTLDRVA